MLTTTAQYIIVVVSAKLILLYRRDFIDFLQHRTHTHHTSKRQYGRYCPAPIIPIFAYRQTDTPYTVTNRTVVVPLCARALKATPPPSQHRVRNIIHPSPEYTCIHINNSGYNNILTGIGTEKKM